MQLKHSAEVPVPLPTAASQPIPNQSEASLRTLLLSTRFILVGVVLLYLLHSLAYWAFHVDDAYISYVYARNLATGNGLTYNGLVVEGYSNFSWTILMAVAIRIGIAPLLAARVLSLISGLWVLALTQRISSRLLPTSLAWASFLPPLLLSVLTPFAAWTVAGMETMWFTLLVTLSLDLTLDPRTRYGIRSAMVTLLCALTRPEGILILPVLALYNYSTRAKAEPDHRRRLIQWLSLILLPFAAYLFWRFSTYGYFFPNTAYLKLDPTWLRLSESIKWIIAFFLLRPIYGLAVLFGTILLVVNRRSVEPQWWLVVGLSLGFVAFILGAGRDWMPHHRFLIPILPLLSIMAVAPLAALIHSNLRWAGPVLLALVLSTGLIEVAFSHSLFLEPTLTLGRWTDHLIQTGYWIQANTQDDDIIAVVDAGAIAYYSQRTTIDMLGLNDAHIAHCQDKSDPAYILSYQPAIVQLHIAPSLSGEGCMATDSSAGADLYAAPAFRANYHNALPDGPMCQDLFVRVSGLTEP